MAVVTLSLATALAYAVHDYLMMPVLRRTSVIAALLWIKLVAVAVLLAIMLAFGGWPSGGEEWQAAGYAALGGAVEVAAFASFLNALSKGKLAIISPLSALSGAFTVAFVLMLGESVAPLVWVGLPLAIVGSILTSVERSEDGNGSRTAAAGAGWAILTSALFGLITVFFGESAALPPVTVAMFASFATLAGVAPIALARGKWRVDAPFRRRVGTCGLLDAGALIAFAGATALGPLAVVGVVVAQAGTMAVLMGLILLRERPTVTQTAGVVVTLAAVTILSAVA